jgi:RNA-directed DNA polymerase
VGEQKPAGKPFEIPKQEVWDAWLKVKANGGAPGADGQSIEDFEADLKNNLYKVWNRMSSGSYFPPPVKAVEIPKAHGAGVRILGVPTVADRVAQTVVAARLEKEVEPKFHDDSYGYRPGRSALDAVGNAGNAAGSTTGSLIWTSGSSSTAFRGISSSKRWRPILPMPGLFCM